MGYGPQDHEELYMAEATWHTSGVVQTGTIQSCTVYHTCNFKASSNHTERSDK